MNKIYKESQLVELSNLPIEVIEVIRETITVLILFNYFYENFLVDIP